MVGAAGENVQTGPERAMQEWTRAPKNLSPKKARILHPGRSQLQNPLTTKIAVNRRPEGPRIERRKNTIKRSGKVLVGSKGRCNILLPVPGVLTCNLESPTCP